MRLLDLFCGAGGAAMGYKRAGFDVVGVDCAPQPNYPFEFHQRDALEFLVVNHRDFDAIHASPPCQGYSALGKGTNGNSHKHPQLLDETRQLLTQTGLPWVIENVPQAPINNRITLCGEMFGLGVIRHRWFESNFLIMQPEHIPHRGLVRGWRHGKMQDGPYLAVYGRGGYKGTLDEWREAMGIDWMTRVSEFNNAIPPAYTEYIGQWLAMEVTGARA